MVRPCQRRRPQVTEDVPSTALRNVRWLWVFLLLGSRAVCLVRANSASQRNAYNPYQYDQVTPQFTPDGRLLQVEYAGASADHSSPVIVAKLADDFLLVVSVREEPQPDGNHEIPTGGSVQQRLLVWNDRVLLALSGVLPDSLALLQILQDETLSSRRWYGTELSGTRVANVLANACQQHAFGGGLRPYGSTILVLSAAPHDSAVSTVRVDPSGAVVPFLQQQSNETFLVTGGGARKGLADAWRRRLAKNALTGKSVPQALRSIRTMAQEEFLLRKAGVPSPAKDSTPMLPFLEVALVSRTHGVYKLSTARVKELLSLTAE